MPWARKELKGKETGAKGSARARKVLGENICEEKQSARSKERILGERDMSRSEGPRSRKELRGKYM